MGNAGICSRCGGRGTVWTGIRTRALPALPWAGVLAAMTRVTGAVLIVGLWGFDFIAATYVLGGAVGSLAALATFPVWAGVGVWLGRFLSGWAYGDEAEVLGT